MAGAQDLLAAEVGMIKTMLNFFPKLSNQAILSYFTRPGRDLNHRLIAEIADWRGLGVSPAPLAETLAYMADCAAVRHPSADRFYDSDEGISLANTVLATMEVNWWPVGQGLFHSGRLKIKSGGEFTWVYDCGSSSDASIRDVAIQIYRKLNTHKYVDLVTLSHFDADHINGIVSLIRNWRVGTLLLPYVPLWQRLLIAIAEGIGSEDPLLGFFIDPATYLANIEGSEIGEIVFVVPANPDDIVPEAGELPTPERPLDKPKVEYGTPPSDAADDPALGNSAGIPVRFLHPTGRIVVSSLWEFVPYNDAQMQPRVTGDFIKRAARAARIFVAWPRRRSAMLKYLNHIYSKKFGSGSKSRNRISLFLYSGPIANRVQIGQIIASAPIRLNEARDNFSQISTGDGYLETSVRLDELRRFYSRDRRLSRAGIVQVMHHGANGNWHVGVAAALEPAVSIFSSDPSHKGLSHPHAEVLRDFWPWCPVQVDRVNGFHLTGLLRVA